MDNEKKTSKYDEYISKVDPLILEKWKVEQDELKKNLIEYDDLSFTLNPNNKTKPFLKRVGGVDISTMKDDISKAVAALVVLDYATQAVNIYVKL